jgi:hypothetical protein
MGLGLRAHGFGLCRDAILTGLQVAPEDPAGSG